jgi:hypothetical protein
MTHDRTEELAVINLVSAMTKSQRLEMLRDVVQNMAERGDAEEIADFVGRGCRRGRFRLRRRRPR